MVRVHVGEIVNGKRHGKELTDMSVDLFLLANLSTTSSTGKECSNIPMEVS